MSWFLPQFLRRESVRIKAFQRRLLNAQAVGFETQASQL